MTGLHLAQYRIDAELGRGGMGIVYRATDTKLERTVALKVLPPHALSSADDRARFYREARAAAKLNHPHIATIHQIDEAPLLQAGTTPAADAEARPFIAMEYVDGESLAARIAKGPLKLEEAVRIASQVAEALGAAHEAGVVHRDVKSANVMLTAKGEAKVLDFGLAQTAASTKLTRMGATLGTIAYMSPEQARGEEVDRRTDLWSLGVVLYEMVAGRLPFVADYEQATLYGILNEDPQPVTALRTGVPMELEQIVDKLMAKEPRLRYQATGDVVADLARLDVRGFSTSRTSLRAMPAAAGRTRRIGGIPPTWVGVGLVVAVLVWIVFGRNLGGDGGAPEPPAREYFLALDPGTDVVSPTVSPDGTYLVYVAHDSTGGGVFLYRFDGQPAIRLPLDADGWKIWISPDSKTIIASDPLQAYSLETGAVTTLDARSLRGFGLLRPDRPEYVTVGQTSGLDALPLDGGAARAITTLGEGEFSHARMSLLPDGRALMVVFTAASLDSAVVEIVDLDTGERQRVLSPGYNPVYIETGHLLFGRGLDGRAFVQRFDLSSGEVSGPAVDLGPRFTRRAISFDRYGTAVVGPLFGVNRASGESIFRVEADGLGGELPVRTTGTSWISASRDGRVLAITLRDGSGEVRVYDADHAQPRLTFRTGGGPGELDSSGRRIAYFTDQIIGRELAVRDLATGREVRFTLSTPGHQQQWVGERSLVYAESPGPHSAVLVRLDLETGAESGRLTLNTPASNLNYMVSPEGEWVAFRVVKNRDLALYLQRLDGNEPAVEIAGGEFKLIGWSTDGDRLWLEDRKSRARMFMETEFEGLNLVRVGAPTSDSNEDSSSWAYPIENGGMILVGIREESARQAGVLVIERWFDEVRRLLPPRG